MLDGVNDTPAQARAAGRAGARQATRRAVQVQPDSVQPVPRVGPEALAARARRRRSRACCRTPASSPRCARRAATTSTPPAASWPARCRTARACRAARAARPPVRVPRRLAARAPGRAGTSAHDARERRWRLRGRRWRWLLAALVAGCAAPPQPAARRRTRLATASPRPTRPSAASARACAWSWPSAYFSRGQMTTALDEVKLALAADPTCGEAYNLRGLIYASLGDDGLAEESFRRALQLNPRDADTMHNYGWFLCQQKRYAEANAQFDQALAAPQYRDAARTPADAGRVPGARRPAGRGRSAACCAPTSSTRPIRSTAVNLSEVLYRRGDYERARFYIRRVNSRPTSPARRRCGWRRASSSKLGNRAGAQRARPTSCATAFPQSREAGRVRAGAASMSEATAAASRPARRPARARCCAQAREAPGPAHRGAGRGDQGARRASSSCSRPTASTSCPTPPSRARWRRPCAAR